MVFPGEFLRGIPNKDFLKENGVSAHLFYFNDRDLREDNWIEQSINWNDDLNATQFTLDMTHADGRLKHIAAAVMQTVSLEYVKQLPGVHGVLDYERRVVVGNNYHGNLLLNKGVPSHEMKKIAAAIALTLTRVENHTPKMA